MGAETSTLELLVTIQRDVTGLTQTVSAMQQGMATMKDSVKQFSEKANESLKSVEQHANGVSSALMSFFGGIFAVGRLKRFAEEALQLARVEAQLEQALRGTGQYSVEYREQLTLNAKALQQVTGASKESLLSVERFLVQGGVGPELIKPLTEGVLDLATAMNVDVVSAARIVSNLCLASTTTCTL